METILGQHSNDLREALAHRVPVLIVLRGAQIGRRYLLNETSLVLGRKTGVADILIEGDPQVSAAHCRVERTDDRYRLKDLRSLNGTFVNGATVTEIPLYDGDKIAVGQTILKFTFLDAIEEDFHGVVDQMMNMDDLTGLPVLRRFQERFRNTLAETIRDGEPLAVLMMDMDGLKKINDTHGHQFGAYSISELGKLVGSNVRGKGDASRFGGDEFVVFLCRMSKEQALDEAEAIRRQVLDHTFCLDDVVLQPTVSIGVAAYPEDGGTVEILIRKADEALYRAKRAGRNCVSQ